MVQNLSATRVYQETQTREVLESFRIAETSTPDLADLSLYVLEPYFHVKLYQMLGEVDLKPSVEFPQSLRVVHESSSEAHDVAVYITREVSLPRWTTDDRLSAIQHDLFVFYQDRATHLLFVCASRRTEGLYERLVSTFSAFDPRPLSLVRLNRALNDLATPEFFNIGMRNRVASSTTESYRIITGSNADKAIMKSDGRLYHRGHAFGKASDDGDIVTIGLSSASKIWSNKSAKIPELISWCQTLARRISSNHSSNTGSGLDNLAVGEEIDELPSGIIGVDWPAEVYRNPPIVRYNGRDGPGAAQLLDFELSVDLDATTDKFVTISLRYENIVRFDAIFSFENDRFFESVGQGVPNIFVRQGRGEVDLVDFLNDEMPHFYTADLSVVHGYSLLTPGDHDRPLFNQDQFEVRDWTRVNVDIGREFGPPVAGRVSVHDGLEAELRESNKLVVYYDHGTGEIADFVSIEELQERFRICLFHCKGSTGAVAGHRLGDIYEVACQAVKSVRWALKQRVLSTIRRRFNERKGGHRFVRGDLDQLTDLIEGATAAQIDFEFVVVQPGLKKQGLPAEHSNILAAASDHLVRGGFMPLRIIGSQ